MRSGVEDRLLWENVWQGGRGFLLLVISCALYAGLLFMTEGKARFLLPFCSSSPRWRTGGRGIFRTAGARFFFSAVF